LLWKCVRHSGGRAFDGAGIQGGGFTLDGKATFLMGCSYYAGLGASEENIRADLDDLHRHGFNWVRVWATWAAFDNDVSRWIPRPGAPAVSRQTCVARQGVRRAGHGGGRYALPRRWREGLAAIGGIEAHRQAVRTPATALKERRNWFIDLSNERNVRDKRFTSMADLRTLRDVVKSIDPKRLVTASHTGALTPEDQARYVRDVGWISSRCMPSAMRSRRAGRGSGRSESWPLLRMMRAYRCSTMSRSGGVWKMGAERKRFSADLNGAKAGGRRVVLS